MLTRGCVGHRKETQSVLHKHTVINEGSSWSLQKIDNTDLESVGIFLMITIFTIYMCSD